MAEVYSPLINDKYRISRKLGGGSFGDIYLAIGTNGEKVAVKFEKHTTRCPQLRHEYKVYREMQGATGFGRVHYFGTHDNYNVMVMDLLGPSLEDLFNKCGRRFSLKTVLQLADQMLERIETMHSRHLIHRDVKPANFVLGGSRNPNVCFCIDFGLSTRYRHPRTLQHIPFREGRSLTGTPRYASINNHLGMEQSRRDDLESIGYVLIYFLKGSLPWQGLKARNAKRKYKMIMEKKQSVPIAQLCQGLPQQFAEYLAYCRSLKFDAKPNISYLRGLFRELYRSQGYSAELGLEWDWSKIDGATPQDEDSRRGGAPEQEGGGGDRGGGGGGGGAPEQRERPAPKAVEPSAYNSHLGETTAARLGSTYGHDLHQSGLHSTPGGDRKYSAPVGGGGGAGGQGGDPAVLGKGGTPGGSRNSASGRTPRLLGTGGSQGSRPQVDSAPGNGHHHPGGGGGGGGGGHGVTSAPPLGHGHRQASGQSGLGDSRSGGRRSTSQGAGARGGAHHHPGGAAPLGYDNNHLPAATPKQGEDWRGKESGGAWSGRIFGNGRAQSAQHSRPHTAHGLRTGQDNGQGQAVGPGHGGVLMYSQQGTATDARGRAQSAETSGWKQGGGGGGGGGGLQVGQYSAGAGGRQQQGYPGAAGGAAAAAAPGHPGQRASTSTGTRPKFGAVSGQQGQVRKDSYYSSWAKSRVSPAQYSGGGAGYAQPQGGGAAAAAAAGQRSGSGGYYAGAGAGGSRPTSAQKNKGALVQRRTFLRPPSANMHYS